MLCCVFGDYHDLKKRSSHILMNENNGGIESEFQKKVANWQASFIAILRGSWICFISRPGGTNLL